MNNAEQELARLSAASQQQELRTWERPRSSQELGAWVTERLAEIGLSAGMAPVDLLQLQVEELALAA